MKLLIKCPYCQKSYTLDVDRDEYEKYRNGELVQRAFKSLPAHKREMLISGMCEECQEKIFKVEE